MKITYPLVSILLGLYISNTVYAQEYIRLNQNEVVYDVDVVVFARRLAQPSTDTFNNAPLVKTEAVRVLSPWNRQSPLLMYPEPEEKPQANETSDKWQVPIEEKPKLVDVLSWILLANNMNHPVVKRLEVNPNLKPLMHQKWRQPATAFLNPEYVELSQIKANDIPVDDTEHMNTLFPPAQVHADYSIDGQVAFSKQRFTHLHVKMNLFRINTDGKQVIHEISQQKRIELGQWQYFDHQHFGILAKVTAVQLTPTSQGG